ncbi:MAG: hypothetical protein ACR5KV_04440 [Wolbachia sp.]
MERSIETEKPTHFKLLYVKPLEPIKLPEFTGCCTSLHISVIEQSVWGKSSFKSAIKSGSQGEMT